MLRNFYCYRQGQGVVAHGVQHLVSGKVVVFWSVEDKPNSIEIFDNLREARRRVDDAEFLWWDASSYHPAGSALADYRPAGLALADVVTV